MKATVCITVHDFLVSSIFMYTDAVCMSVGGCHVPGTEDTDSCELPCGYWEMKPGPLEVYPVLLIAKSSLL